MEESEQDWEKQEGTVRLGPKPEMEGKAGEQTRWVAGGAEPGMLGCKAGDACLESRGVPGWRVGGCLAGEQGAPGWSKPQKQDRPGVALSTKEQRV